MTYPKSTTMLMLKYYTGSIELQIIESNQAGTRNVRDLDRMVVSGDTPLDVATRLRELAELIERRYLPKES